MKKEFKDIIKELRLEKDWTQAELGAKLNVTAQTVSKWEKGSMPDISLIMNTMSSFKGLERPTAKPSMMPCISHYSSLFLFPTKTI